MMGGGGGMNLPELPSEVQTVKLGFELIGICGGSLCNGDGKGKRRYRATTSEFRRGVSDI